MLGCRGSTYLSRHCPFREYIPESNDLQFNLNRSLNNSSAAGNFLTAEDKYNFGLSSAMSILSEVLVEGSYGQIKLVLLWLTGERSFSQLPATVV